MELLGRNRNSAMIGTFRLGHPAKHIMLVWMSRKHTLNSKIMLSDYLIIFRIMFNMESKSNENEAQTLE